jgi:hypothetical protein
MKKNMWQSYLLWNDRDITYSWLNFISALIRKVSHLTEQRLHTSWQQKVFTKLLGLNYKIIYKKGIDNKVVDALSRRPDP